MKKQIAGAHSNQDIVSLSSASSSPVSKPSRVVNPQEVISLINKLSNSDYKIAIIKALAAENGHEYNALNPKPYIASVVSALIQASLAADASKAQEDLQLLGQIDKALFDPQQYFAGNADLIFYHLGINLQRLSQEQARYNTRKKIVTKDLEFLDRIKSRLDDLANAGNDISQQKKCLHEISLFAQAMSWKADSVKNTHCTTLWSHLEDLAANLISISAEMPDNDNVDGGLEDVHAVLINRISQEILGFSQVIEYIQYKERTLEQVAHNLDKYFKFVTLDKKIKDVGGFEFFGELSHFLSDYRNLRVMLDSLPKNIEVYKEHHDLSIMRLAFLRVVQIFGEYSKSFHQITKSLNAVDWEPLQGIRDISRHDGASNGLEKRVVLARKGSIEARLIEKVMSGDIAYLAQKLSEMCVSQHQMVLHLLASHSLSGANIPVVRPAQPAMQATSTLYEFANSQGSSLSDHGDLIVVKAAKKNPVKAAQSAEVPDDQFFRRAKSISDLNAKLCRVIDLVESLNKLFNDTKGMPAFVSGSISINPQQQACEYIITKIGEQAKPIIQLLSREPDLKNIAPELLKIVKILDDIADKIIHHPHLSQAGAPIGVVLEQETELKNAKFIIKIAAIAETALSNVVALRTKFDQNPKVYKDALLSIESSVKKGIMEAGSKKKPANVIIEEIKNQFSAKLPNKDIPNPAKHPSNIAKYIDANREQLELCEQVIKEGHKMLGSLLQRAENELDDKSADNIKQQIAIARNFLDSLNDERMKVVVAFAMQMEKKIEPIEFLLANVEEIINCAVKGPGDLQEFANNFNGSAAQIKQIKKIVNSDIKQSTDVSVQESARFGAKMEGPCSFVSRILTERSLKSLALC